MICQYTHHFNGVLWAENMNSFSLNGSFSKCDLFIPVTEELAQMKYYLSRDTKCMHIGG